MKEAASQIKNSLRISQIIAQKVSLKSKGNGDFIGLCPFHSEKTPSFTVSDAKGFYHCFGCGAHGDIFSFIMETENYNYIEAVRKLAAEAGVILPKFDKGSSKLEPFYEVYKCTADFFHEALYGSSGRSALDYLYSRGLSDEIIKNYKLGFADINPLPLISYLKSKFDIKTIRDSKLFNFYEDRMDNPFKGRVIFPITNEMGKEVAFGGRALSSTGKPKYLNSTDNPIFNKSTILYGLSNAKREAYKQGFVLLVEGYMDVISLAESGINNAVAPLGTSIHKGQIASLWSKGLQPVICMDSDEAGQAAALRVAHLMLPDIRPNNSLKFCNLIGGKDPDEIIRNKGVEHFRHLVEKSQSLSEYIFYQERQKRELKTPEQKAEFQEYLQKVAAVIKNSSLKYNYKQYFFSAIREQSSKKNSPTHYNAIASLKAISSSQMLFFWLYYYPDLLKDHGIFEEMNRVELADSLDKLRNLILSIDIYNGGKVSSCIEQHLDITNSHIVVAKGLSFEKAKHQFYRVLNLHCLDAITKEIEITSYRLSTEKDEETYNRLLALKQQEEKLKKELGVI